MAKADSSSYVLRHRLPTRRGSALNTRRDDQRPRTVTAPSLADAVSKVAMRPPPAV